MSKMTFKYTASFDLTAVVDTVALDGIIAEMREVLSSKGSELDVKTKAMIGLVLQAYDKSPEHGYAEMMRTSVRIQMNDLASTELLADEDRVTLRPSPVKVVCHGIEI